jgi:phytoene dehydrogenase-like protein
LAREVGNIRCRGTLAAVSFALAARPRFRCRPDQVVSVAQWGETPDQQEKAWDDAKHRRFPRRPSMDIRVHEDEGGWVLQVLVRSAAFDLEGGWGPDRRADLAALVTSQLGELVCEFENTLLASEVLTPVDLAQNYGLDGGHELQAEIALDQLHAFRPSRSLAHYRSPVAGLWLGSAGSHPGGGVSGTAGLLAAAALLRS